MREVPRPERVRLSSKKRDTGWIPGLDLIFRPPAGAGFALKESRGRKRAEGTYKNKELSGIYRSWHENGRKASEGGYIDGKEQGLWKTD